MYRYDARNTKPGFVTSVLAREALHQSSWHKNLRVVDDFAFLRRLVSVAQDVLAAIEHTALRSTRFDASHNGVSLDAAARYRHSR
ncbi:hypothetical protein MTO96_028005 [Rhipicephalus appendiculatus]